MSHTAIGEYYKELQSIKDYGGTIKETSIRTAFISLLQVYASQKGLRLITEHSIKTPSGRTVTPDGTIKDSLRLDWGYWESKDEADDIDVEIEKKFAKSYPKDNILFEDSRTAVLFQNGIEVLRIEMKNADALDRILKAFINYERPEIVQFHKAIELFKSDIPSVVESLRAMMDEQEKTNSEFIRQSDLFLDVIRQAINPDITQDDIREMMIQHILTADIFNTIFDEPYFHRENNIAKQLENLINTFFTREIRNQLLSKINIYYQAINASAAGIADHHEKQKFLKIVYENFYKSYNPKAADRLGVVYTPNEIVRFMIESIDYLLHKHFGRMLSDKNVEFLDPATGTGTYICDLIDYLPKDKLEYKYRNEIHANEVAILPYYIANLNIEFIYKQRMGQYAEFKNLCFVDTLDNVYAFEKTMGKSVEKYKTSGNMFAVSFENTERIQNQNERRISVIAGNPPYNANQMNENDNNKNRSYRLVDMRIKDTFIKNSTAQKTKLYDMYSRFYRWAMDRLGDEGIIAFITNRSFINSRTFDGFRKTIQDEFNYCYIIDTQSDVRANPKIAGTTHNVFGIQTGVAIMFLVRNKSNIPNVISYHTLTDEMRKEDKLQWLAFNKIKDITFEHIIPDKNNNWINQTDNDWERLVPLISYDVKTSSINNTIFKIFSNGISTNRDSWVYDEDRMTLVNKIKHFIERFNSLIDISKIDGVSINSYADDIKWSHALKNKFNNFKYLVYDESKITWIYYRPFKKVYYYCDFDLSDLITSSHFEISGSNLLNENRMIWFKCGVTSYFFSLGINKVHDIMPNGGSKCLPLFRYDENGNCIDNITDWGLKKFRANYDNQRINKEEIFHYVYAVLHNPAYRTKYELNLKREFPRIPFYDDFFKWADLGKKLMDLHINFEEVEPYKLQLTNLELKNDPYKPKLTANKDKGEIILDNISVLSGIPADAWEYKLGNRSALEWILDQYKEKKPKDPTIREKFNTYRFADYKEKVIDLLMRVTTVSVETMNIIHQMEQEHNT